MNERKRLEDLRDRLVKDIESVDRILELLGNGSLGPTPEADNEGGNGAESEEIGDNNGKWPGMAEALRSAILAMEDRKFTVANLEKFLESTYPGQGINKNSLSGALHKMKSLHQIEVVVPRSGRRAAKYARGTAQITLYEESAEDR